MYRRYLLSLVAALFLPLSAHAGIFSITLDYDADGDGTDNVDAIYQSVFDDALDFWESVIIGTQDNIDVNLVIDAEVAAIDGNFGILGSATNFRAGAESPTSDYLYAIEGFMNFDSADVNRLNNDGSLYEVILHEMAHVIGFGTLWNADRYGLSGQFQDIYTDGSGQYTGAYALSIYEDTFNTNDGYIPIELDGGSGTADAHWDEGWEAGSGEIMTGYLASTTFISDITLASFADIGYIVELSDGTILGASFSEVSSPTSAALGLLTLTFILLRRK